MKAAAIAFAGTCVGLLVKRLCRAASRASRPRVWLIRHGESTFNREVEKFLENNPKIKAEQDADPHSWWEQVRESIS